MKTQATLGVIGGSGLYALRGIKGTREVRVKTPFGAPSGPVVVGSLAGVGCAFLPRHGRGHVLLPSEINNRANLWALKALGVERVLAVTAVGSLKEELKPRHFVVPDQLVDRTVARASTFFGQGIVAHASLQPPFCPAQSAVVHESARELGIVSHLGGTYACMEGPLFSTRAESDFHRAMGWSVIGMTAAPEAKLAREAELCYSVVALVTDYDCWKQGEEVSASQVMETLAANIANAHRLLEAAIPKVAALPRSCACPEALRHALVTDPKAMAAKTVKRLKPLIGRRLAGR